jgi:hypothetical protein
MVIIPSLQSLVYVGLWVSFQLWFQQRLEQKQLERLGQLG